MAWVTVLLVAPLVHAQEGLTISHVSGGAVYLAAGQADGLEVGETLHVVRGAEVIAELEVTFVSERTSASRIVDERRSPQPGDFAILAVSHRPRFTPVPAVSAPSADSPGVTARVPSRVAGKISVRHKGKDNSERAGRDSDVLRSKVVVRARGIGGRPLEARVRLRSIVRRPEGRPQRRQDLLYEAALGYRARDGSHAYRLGRIGASPYLGTGYLDGLMARGRVRRRLQVGGFLGRMPDADRPELDSSGQKLGAFMTYHSGEGARWLSDVTVGAIHESDGDRGRDYLLFTSRLGSSESWDFTQTAELDFHNRERPGRGPSLSRLSLWGDYAWTGSVRVGFSYRRTWIPYAREKEDDLPDDLVAEVLREGAEGHLFLGNGEGWNGKASFGVRGAEQGAFDTYAFTGSVFNSNITPLRISVGADLALYRGGSADGYMLALSAHKGFEAGHGLGVSLGRLVADLYSEDESHDRRWVRLSGTVVLPMQVFVEGEVETRTLEEGHQLRQILELGYRF